jgi:hypothetical protein
MTDRSRDLAFSLTLVSKERLRNLLTFATGDRVIKIGATWNNGNPDYSYMNRLHLIDNIDLKNRIVMVHECVGENDGKFYKINPCVPYTIKGFYLDNWANLENVVEPYKSEIKGT